MLTSSLGAADKTIDRVHAALLRRVAEVSVRRRVEAGHRRLSPRRLEDGRPHGRESAALDARGSASRRVLRAARQRPAPAIRVRRQIRRSRRAHRRAPRRVSLALSGRRRRRGLDRRSRHRHAEPAMRSDRARRHALGKRRYARTRSAMPTRSSCAVADSNRRSRSTASRVRAAYGADAKLMESFIR